MGMKSRSGHFAGNNAGGVSKRQGRMSFEINLQTFAKMPKGRAQIMHILADRKGHLAPTPENAKLLEDISDDERNFIRVDENGNRVYAKIIKGNQYWVYARNDIIQDGGANKPGEHRDYNPKHYSGRKHKK